MIKNKKILGVVLAAMLAAASAFPAAAEKLGTGQWCDVGSAATDESHRFWFTLAPDGSKFLANTWYWIQDSDGVVRCYYFDYNGWLVVNNTVDGYTLDGDGHWVSDGKVQTAPAGQNYVSHSSTFISSGSSAAATATAAATPTPAASTAKNSKVLKTTAAGPEATTDALPYAISNLSGRRITNSWANITMDFSGTNASVTLGNEENRLDFFADSNGSWMSSRFVEIGTYGGSSLSEFAAGLVKDGRGGVKGGTVKGNVTLGSYTFIDIAKSVADPNGTTTDHTYIRQVEGTNFVQVISIQSNGEAETYQSVLSSIGRTH